MLRESVGRYWKVLIQGCEAWVRQGMKGSGCWKRLSVVTARCNGQVSWDGSRCKVISEGKVRVGQG